MKYNFREERITIKGEYNLGATLTIPSDIKGKVNAVLLVVGTGTGDRDGNIPKKKMNMGIYKDLSDFFAEHGLVTLRYDKRGVGESKGINIETGVQDLVNDIISNIEYLESLEYVDKIILCGHSEGAMLSPIANSIKPVDGLIALAGAGTSILTALEYQNHRAMEEIKTMKGLKGWIGRKQINEENYMKNVNKMFKKARETDKDVARIQGMKIPVKWTREHGEYKDEDMLNYLKNAKCPIIAITGDKDVQANPEDLKKIDALDEKHIETQVIPNMDHILKEFDGELTILDLMKQYSKEFEKPLHPMLLEVIEKWLQNL